MLQATLNFLANKARLLRAAVALAGVCLATQASAQISWSSYSATVGQHTTMVVASGSVAVAGCSSNLPFEIKLYRDSTLIYTTTGIGFSYNDTGAVPGTMHVYQATAKIINPGSCTVGFTATTPNFNGLRLINSPPSPMTLTSASDGTFQGKVTVSYSRPDNTTLCGSGQHVLVRDGTDVGVISTVMTGTQTSTYDDLTGIPGTTYTYSIRTDCTTTGLSATSGSDPGYAGYPNPPPPSAVTASDGTFNDRVRIAVTAPAAAMCASRSVVIARDGSDIASITTIPVTGGSASYDDMAPAAGTHSYSARSLCLPGNTQSSNVTDTGYVMGTPIAPTTVVATDGDFTDRVRVTWVAPDQSSACSSISYVIVRNSVDIGTSTFTTLAGGNAQYDDMTAPPGVNTYAVRAVCQPGAGATLSGNDTGFKSVPPPAPSAVTASDYTFPDRVRVSITLPAAPICVTRDVILARDGTDIATITTVPVTGGTTSYDDIGPSLGLHTYTARSVCNPGGAQSGGISDDGAIGGVAPVCSSVQLPSGPITYSSSGSVAVTVTGILNATSAHVEVYNSLNGTNDVMQYPLTGAPSGTASISLSNHAVGIPEYGPLVVNAMVRGQDPNAPAVQCATASVAIAPAAPSGFVASKGTYTDEVRFSWSPTSGVGTFTIYQCPFGSGSAVWQNPDNTGNVTLSGQACLPVVTNIPGGDSTATLLVQGTAHQNNSYVIHATSASGSINTAFSRMDNGYPNRAPTSAVATGILVVGNPGQFPTTVRVTDANPTDAWTMTLPQSSSAQGGTLTVSGGAILYTPPPLGITGTDTFSFLATDMGGASVVGSGTVVAGCPDPTISGITSSPSRKFPNVGYRVQVSYGNGACAQNHDAVVEILSGVTVIGTYTQTAIPSAVGAQLTFDLPALSSPGYYTARTTIRNTLSGRQVLRDHTFQVSAFLTPAVTITQTALEKIQTVTLQTAASADCGQTTSQTTAAADTTKCLVEVVGLPAGLTQVAAAQPTWSGVVSTAGTYQVTVKFSQYDANGVLRLLGSSNVTTTILPLSSLRFAADAALTAKMHIQSVSSRVAQTGGATCPLTETVSDAQSAGATHTLRCLLTFGALPTGFTRVPFGITGTPHAQTVAPIGWTVSIFDSSGLQTSVATGSIVVTVVQPDLRFNATFNPASPVTAISRVVGSVGPIGTDSCPLTVSAATARDKTRNTCLLEWTTIPPGLTAASTGNDTSIRGTFTTVGQQTASYVVAVYDDAGTRYDVFTGSASVTSVAAPTPVVNLSDLRQVATGVYAAPITGGTYGTLLNCAGCGGISYTQTIAGDTTPRRGNVMTATGKATLQATPAALYAQRATNLRVALMDGPSIYADQSYQLIAVPPDDVRLGVTFNGETFPDTDPITVTVQVGQNTSNGFEYVAASLGDWNVRIGAMQPDGTFLPLTGWIQTDTAGKVTANIPASGTLMRVVAIAQAITPISGYVQEVKSGVKVARVVKGSGVSAVLTTTSPSGPAPLLSTMKIAYATKTDQIINASVVWQVSQDAGVTWTDVPGAVGPVYTTRSPAGEWVYRVKLENRYTQVVSYSPELTLVSWDLPTVNVTGDAYTFPGGPVTLTASAVDGSGSPIVGAVYEWTASPRGSSNPPPTPIASGTGDTATFTPSSAGLVMVKFRVRYPASPAADTRSWSQSIKAVVVDAPQKPIPRIAGPTRAEVGRAYAFNANVAASFPLNGSALTLDGMWTLPDGSTVSGTALNWTPSAADLAASPTATLRYSAWVAGYQATTTVTTTHQVRLWQYVFPTWSISSTRSSTYSPSNFAFTAVASDPSLLTSLEGLTYSWNVPAGLQVIGVPSNKMAATATAGGQYTVSLTVTDSRGNTQTVTSMQQADNPPAFVMDASISTVSRWTHSPLTIGVTPKVTGGHPSDRIVTWSYSVDGVPVSGLPNRAGVQITLPNAASYLVEARADSQMGASVTKSVVVNVPANVPPTCAITPRISANRLMVTLKAVCTDPDGAVNRLQWYVDGVERLGVNVSTWTYYLPAGAAFPITFSLIASDDGGGQGTASATAN